MEWVKDILLAVVIAAVILAFFKPIIVQQQSMEPNFHAGDYLITSRQAYRLFGGPQRGDVIVFKSELLDENEKPKNLIKRIIALPGETIEIKGGEVYIDGAQLREDYLPGEAISGEMDAVTAFTIDKGQKNTQLLIQPQYSPMPVEEQISILYCGTQGLLKEVPLDKVHEFEARFLQELRTSHQRDVLDVLKTGVINDEIRGILEKTAKELWVH